MATVVNPITPIAVAIAGLAGLASPAIVKDARTIEVTLDTATPVPIVKTLPGLVFSNFSYFLLALSDSLKIVVTNFESKIL